MKKTQLVKLIDLMSFVGLLALISTGTVLKYTLPPRSGGMEVWGLSRHEWGNVHFWVSVVFLALISFHLLLHLGFIKKALTGKASREHGYRLAIGLLGIITLILFLMAPVLAPKVEPAGESDGHGYRR